MNCRIWKSSSGIGNLWVTFLRVIPALCLLLLLGTSDTEAQTYSTWTHNKIILFNTSVSGANLAGNVSNFPVLVRLNSGNFDFSQALAGGADIRFEDPDGTALAYQIERWDGGAQEAEIWVLVPQVDGSSTTDYIRMYWGKAGATSLSNGASVFTTPFQGAWHLNEDGNTITSGYADASGNAYHGTGTSMTAVNDVAAVSGIGQDFNGTSQSIDMGAGTNLHGSTALTLEAWVKADTKSAKAPFLSKPFTSVASPYDEYFLGFDGTGVKFMFALTMGSTNYTLQSSMTPTTGTWYHVVGRYDGSTMSIYVNGTQDTSVARTGTIDAYNQSLKLGKYGSNATYFDGILDEVRMSDLARTPDWIKASHASQQSSQSMVVIAPRVWDGGGADPLWSNPLNWNGDVLPTPDEAVLFDGTFLDDATLDLNVSVKSISFTTGYTGNFSFSSYVLTVNQAQADFRSGGTITPGTGTLRFTGAASQNLHPHSSSNLPSIVQDGTGTTTIVSYPASMGNLSINAGTFNLGTGMGHFAASVSTGAGALDFGTSTLNVSGNVDLDGLTSLNSGGGTLGFTAASGTQTFTPKSGAIHPALTKSGAGTVSVSTNALTAGALNLTAGTWDWGGGALSHTVASITTSGSSTMTFGSNSVDVNSGDCDLTGLASLNPGTGYLNFTAPSGTQTFTPKDATTHPNISKTGAGTVMVSGYGLVAKDLALTAGSWDWGASPLTHSIQNLSTGGSPSMTFGASTVQISNSADFSGLSTLVAGSGTMEMVGGIAQTLTPLNGATHPNLLLSGSATTALASYDLTVANLDINSGTLNTNSLILNVGGNLTIAGGTLSASGANVDVDGNITVTSGTLDCPAGNLTLAGSFSQTGGTLTHGSGTLTLDGTLPGKTLNVIGTLYNLTVNGTGGAWTASTNGFTVAGAVSIQAGTFAMGTGLSHSAGSLATTGGTLEFGSSTFSITTGNADMSGLATLTPGSGTIAFTGSGAQTFIPRSGSTHPAVSTLGTGTVTLSANNLTTAGITVSTGGFNQSTLTVTVTGNLSISGGTFTGTDGSLLVNGDFSLSGGSILMPSGTMYVGGNLSQTAGSVIHNSGSLNLNGAAAGKTFDFSPTLYNLIIAGTGGEWTAVNNGFNVANTFQVQAGSFVLGAGLAHSADAVSSTGGSLSFGSSTLNVTGNSANFDALTALTAGSGTLVFLAPSGIQAFTAKAGSTHPHISHNAAGTLQLMTNNLTCLSFTQTAGIMDFNALNLTTVSTGNFSLTNGTSSSVSGLAGRTITVAGNANLAGATSASRLNLNPGTAWTMAVTGSLTGSLVSLDYSNATATAGTCSNCANGGSNNGWTFAVAWDGGGGDANWSSPGNWASDFVPTSLDAVTFNATAIGAILDAPATVKSITFTSGYTGTFSFSSNTLSLTGDADFRSGGAIMAATGTLAFTGPGAQVFIPKSGATFPAILQNGAGGTTISTNNLSAGDLGITSGALNLGSGLVHSVGAVSGSGSLNFGTSDLNATGDVDLSSLTLTASSGNWMTFTGSSAQNFTPNATPTNLQIQQSGSGGTTVLGGITTPWLSVGLGTLNLGSGLTHAVSTTLTLSGGGIDFSSSTLQVNAAAADFTSLASLTAGSGTLEFAGTSAQTFTPNASFTFPAITQSGSGGTTLSTNNLTAGNLSITAGTLDLGTSLSHTVTAVSTTGGGLVFNNSMLGVNTGNAVFSGLTTLTAGSGTLEFTAATGIQSVEAKSAATHPHITHTGAGTLRLMNQSMTCLSFTQSAGIFNFNNYNLTTVSSGNFTINSGTSSSIAGLGGRSLTVAGNAAFNGVSSTDRLGLNPGFTWWLNVTGTASAVLATVDFSDASGGSTASCSNCANMGSNSNWNFNVAWDGGGGDANWTTAANWASDAVPGSTDDVTFNAGTLGAVLDAAATVNSLTMTGGYSGSFDFGSSTLSITGNADFRSGGGIIPNTGTLAFTGTGSQTFIPKTGVTFPAIYQNGNAGTTTITTNPLTAGSLTLGLGTFNLGSSMTHAVAAVSGSGTLDFGTSNLNATGNVNLAGSTVAATTASTLAFTGSSAQTYIPNASEFDLNLTQNGTGGTTVSTNSFTTPTLTVVSGTLNFGTSLVHTVSSTLSISGGGLDFTNSTLEIAAAVVNLSSLTALTAGTGTLKFTGASAQTFTPKASVTHPHITQYGAGGTTIATNGLTAGNLTLNQGTFNLGTSLSHTFASVSDGGGGPYGSLDFNSSQLHVTGSVALGNSPTVTAGSGSLYFEGASGTQSFTPKSGTTFPDIYHNGAGILQLGTYDLACVSFSQTDGTLDFNGRNLSTTLGDFTLTNGASTSLAGLAGRTLTVAGNALFSGASSDDRLNLNPGALWYLDVDGAISVSLATLDYSDATASISAGSCSNCANGGNNTNWTFAVTWDGGGSDSNWTTAQNWGSDAVPTSLDEVTFDATSSTIANLDAAATVKSITFTSGYTGTFSFLSNTLSVTGNADFRSGGPIAAGSGTLAFIGTGAQTFIPKSGSSFPAIVQNGSGGTTTVSTNALTAGDLTLTMGTFNLGSSMTHTIAAISGSGTLDFGTSNLNATGNVNLGTPTVVATTASTLAFTGSSAQTFIPSVSEPDLNLTQNGSGGTTVSTNDFSTPALTIATGTFNLGPSGSHNVLNTLSLTGGGLDFSSSTLNVNAATIDFTNLGSLTPGTGILAFTRASGSGLQAFTPKTAFSFPTIQQNGTAGTYITANDLTATAIRLSSGSISLGTSTVTVDSITSSGGGISSNGVVHILTGDLSLGSITSQGGNATYSFEAASGTQTFTPMASSTYYSIVHAGSGTLRLATNPLACYFFSQSAGTFDFNGLNLTIANTSGSNITVTNGTSTSFTGLAGRTLTVNGSASFSGTSAADKLNLNPASAWTLNVTGTLIGSLASIANSNATGSAASGNCSNCENLGSNTNWNFALSWVGGGGNSNWTTPANWGSNSIPSTADDVSFTATANDAILDAAASVKSITFSTGYTGTFSFSSNTLSVTGNADFRSGGAITAGTGALAFIGTSAQTFIPKTGALFPAITLNGTGGVTLSTNSLSAGDLTLSSGNLTLGTGMTHSVGSIVPGSGGGIIFGNSTLQASGASVSFANLGTLNYGTGTLEFTGTSAQTFTGKSGVFHPDIRQNGTGGTTIATNNWTTGTLTIAAGTWNLGTGRSIVANNFSGTGGGIDFGSSTLEIDGATVDFSSLSAVTAGSGTLMFGGGSAQTFTPKSGATFPDIRQYGSGGTTIATNNLTAGILTLNQGTFNLGASLSHTFASVNDGGGGPYGNLNFGSSQLHVTGDVTLGNVPTLTPGTGTLAFDGASGTQIFVPVSGGVSHPAITHSGAATLQLSTNNLSCLGFTQSAGSLDFNGMNVTTTGSGSFTVTNGTTTSFVGLAARTLTVAGNASFTGTSASTRIGMNPGSAWTLAVTGSLTAQHATLGDNTASVSAGTCSDCGDDANNVNWTMPVTWDGGGAGTAWTTAANWGSDAVPTSNQDVVFNATSMAATLDAAATIKSITFTSGYTGTFDFSSNTLTIGDGDADFSSGGAFTPGTGVLTFAGSTAQTFIPKSGSSFPNIFKTGAGTTTVITNSLTAGDLTVNTGSFHLGSSLAHSVDSIGGDGTLDFGTSTLNASGNVNLAGLTVTASTANTLSFTGTAAQTYTPKASVTDLNLTQNGTGGTTVLSYGFTTPTLAIASGTLDLGAGLSHSVGTSLNLTGGGLAFNSSTLGTAAATVDLRNLASLDPGSGALEFTGSFVQSFIPMAGGTLPALIQSGAGGTTVSVNAVAAGALTISDGIFSLGVSPMTHSVASLATSGGGLTINGNTLDIASGNADFSGLASLDPGTGTVSFSASTGTQILTPHASSGLPDVAHLGAGILRLAGNPLTCISFEQSAGSFDFNSLNVTATPGDFTIQNGTPGSLTGLAGRTLTVGGNATLDGSSGSNRLNLDPGSAWTLAATGTVSASFVTIANSNATVSSGLATNSVDNGTNTGWTFAITWSGAGTNENWSTAANWASNSVPGASVNVVFNGTGTKAAILDTAGAVNSIIFTSGYTGDFSFSGNTLTVAGGDADFRSGGAVNAGTGALTFTSSGPQEFHPKAGAAFPNIVQNGSGITTVMTNTLSAGNLTVTSGTFNLGTGFTHSIAALSGSGSLDFGESNLDATGDADLSGLVVVASSGNTLAFTGASTQVFTPNASVTTLHLTLNGPGGVIVSGNGFTTPNLLLSAGNLNLGTGLTHLVTTGFTLSGGSLDFNTSTLKVAAPAVDLTALTTLTAGTGTLEFTGASQQTFTPKESANHPAIIQSGTGGTTVATRDLAAGDLNITGGTWSLGTGLTHLVSNISSSAGGLSFGSSTLQVAGNANLGSLSALSPGTGNIVFIASSGTQVLTPAAGATYPSIAHTGAGILQLAANPLTCASFYQSAGTLDLNGQDLSTAGAGDIAVTGGSTSSFTGLAGRTVTVGGNATFTGQTGNLINLNPASAWTLAVAGTLSATLAQVANCNASSAAGDGVSSVDGGGNTNWAFSVTWDGGGTNEYWTTGGNWSSDVIPAASTKVIFDGTSPKDCQLDGAVTVKAIRFDSTYTGGFFFNTNTLNVTGDADFRSGGAIVAGSGSLAFAGALPQTFIPKAGAVFPGITQNGTGGTTLAQNGLNAAALSLMNGTLTLGQGLTHAAASVGGSGGGLDFSGSTLKVTGNTDLSGLAAVTAGTGLLEFTGSSAQAFSPKASAIHPRIAQTGTGTTTLSSNGLNTTSLRIADGGLNLGAALSHLVSDTLIGVGGTLDFGSSTLKTAAASPDFSGLSALVPGTGTLEFNGASPQAFTPKSLATHPSLSQNGAGGTILLGSLTAGHLSIASGTFNLGASFSHAFTGFSSTGGGLDFGGSLLSTTGSADFSGLSILTAGSGTLSFTASSGTHVFIPKSGAVHPLIAHHAADTLRLSTSALSALGFAQTAGVLDLNGYDLTLAAGGDLDLFGGDLPILGLGGRTLTVSGDARFAGTASAKLELNPASAWTLAVGGLLSAANVRLGNSVASSSGGVADSSLNMGGNTNWIFLDSIKPDNVSSFLASALGGTSAALSWTPSISEDADSVTIRYRTDGAYPANSTDGTLWRRVPAARSTDTATGLAEKVVYHFAAFVKDSSGNYSPSAAGAQDSARTPDVTPPANASTLAASGITETSVGLSWTPSATPDADTVMIRYLAGTTHPADTTDGVLWKKLPNGFANDTVTGLAANTVYAFSLFVRDSAGNYSPAAAGAQDTSLYQLPVSGTFAINDLSGLTGDSDPSVAFTWSGADSLRFGQSADTGASTWKAVRSLDSVALGAYDGLKILAVQFKNIYGTRSPWYFDTTTLDRKAPVVTLDLKTAHSRWDWPVSVSGKSKDSLAGTDRVFVVRRRLADDFHFNGASWVSTPDTAKLVLGASDSIFSAPLPATAMTTGDYQFTVYARDLAGNVSAPVVTAVHFEENRMPALAFGNVPDTVLQNQSGDWSLDFGDMDAADSLVTVSFDAPAWLTAAPGPDTSYAPWALHKVFTLSGKPLQAHVGSNTVRVLMQDRAGLIYTYAKPILVVDVNDAPVFADSQAVYSVDEDAVSRWTPGFKDEDAMDTHTMTLLAGPAFAKVEGLDVVFNPASRDVGDHSVRIAVSDGSLRDTLETLVTVKDVNDPPYAFPSRGWQSPAYWKEDQRDTFTVVVVDMDRNDPVNLVTPMPAFVKVSSTVDSTGFNRTFRFVLTPGQGDTGSISLALTFQDAAGATSKLALMGRVVPFNDTPFAAIEDIITHAGAARIRLSVTDEDGSLEKARFHYRLIGASGDTLRRGITPSSQLALHPLADGAYAIAVMAEDQDGAKQPAYTVKPFSISGATRIVLDSARWHMLGAPHASLPASVFGAGATLASWDETGDDGQPLARYSSGKTVVSLNRGKGYWVRLPLPITVNATRSDLLEGPFTLKLTHSKQGWNQVANPYPYFVDVSASRLTWWEWDAEKRDLVNARGLLKPWAAYWVLAPRDTTLILSDAPYFPAVAGALAKASASGADFRNREDWSVQLALQAGGYHDQANLLGVRNIPGVPDTRSTVVGAGAPGLASEPGLPGLSLPDAPKFGDYVALHFEKTGLGADQGFATDFHSRLDPEEEWWDISVENTGTGENQAQLTPAGLEGLAKNGLNLFLVRQGEATRIEPGGSVTLSLDAEKTYYSLVVTPHADFASRLKGNFSISQNFPNPVTTFTAFRFFLPQSWDKDGKRMAKDFKLRINLYDYSGRRVAQVASGSFRPGSHTLLWRPVSNGGGALSKGAYIYRLETAGFVKSLKLVVE